MNYTSAVSIIPGGCPQFLDCRLDAKSLGRFWAYFREIPQTGESAIASARRQVELVPVPLDDTGQPGDYDYKIDANRALEAFTGRWVPVPFLRLSNEQWKDGVQMRKGAEQLGPPARQPRGFRWRLPPDLPVRYDH